MRLGFDGALSQSEMTVSPDCSLHFTNTGSEVFLTLCSVGGSVIMNITEFGC